MRNGWTTACVLVACVFATSPAWAAGRTVISNKLDAKEFGPTAVEGPTALCAHVRVEGNAQMDPKAGSGEKCNDQTTIGPKNEPIINQDATRAVGDALKNAVGLKFQNRDPLELGRGIFYEVDKSDDKVKAAADGGGEENFFARAAIGNQPTASASHTVKKKPDGTFEGDGTATLNAPGRGQFGVAILNDPVVFQAPPEMLDPLVTFVLGSALSLSATEPGDFAEAFVQIGQDLTPVLDLLIRVTFDTVSKGQTLIPLGCNPSLLGGFASCSAYLDDRVLPLLDFNPGTHSLSATGDITLFRMTVPDDGTAVTATFNIVGIAATTVPEPSVTAVLAIAVAALAVVRAPRRR